MKRLSVLFATLVLISVPVAASEDATATVPAPAPEAELQPTAPPPAPAPENPSLETPEPLFASYCRAVAMTSCDDGTWLVCEGNVQCDFGWKWVWCDGQSWVCPECSWGGPCL